MVQERLPLFVMMMSVPLFFSYQFKRPPDFLEGIPFVVLWTWGIVSALIVPVLAVAEVVLLSRLWLRRPTGDSPLMWHGAALLVAVAAEICFFLARRSSGA